MQRPLASATSCRDRDRSGPPRRRANAVTRPDFLCSGETLGYHRRAMRDEQSGQGGGTAKADKDRRSSARLPIEMWVEEVTDGSQVFRRAGNLSRGGMHLDHTIPIPLGTRVRLRFTLPGDSSPVLVTAEIVSIATNNVLGMGVKFIDLEPVTQTRIDAYLLRALTPVP
jgi:uncharacterized protein (TIGR02266 family)